MNAEKKSSARIVQAIRTAFPEDALGVDEILHRIGYGEDAYHAWIEMFSQQTSDAIRRQDFCKATDHLQLVASLLDPGDEEIIRCIDVSYVESLMWDIKDEKLLRAGWKIIPKKLKDLYVAMWGERPFMKDVK